MTTRFCTDLGFKNKMRARMPRGRTESELTLALLCLERTVVLPLAALGADVVVASLSPVPGHTDDDPDQQGEDGKHEDRHEQFGRQVEPGVVDATDAQADHRDADDLRECV